AREARVDRNQVVGAADLDAMAGIVDHCDVSFARGVLELPDAALEIKIADIDQRIDAFKTGVLEHFGDRRGVARRVRQRVDGLIVRIADHQRHALLGESSIRDEAKQKRCENRNDDAGKTLRHPTRPWWSLPATGVSFSQTQLLAELKSILS